MKSRLINLIASLLFFSFCLHAQPANDNPCQATTLSLVEKAEGCTQQTYNVVGATYLNLTLPNDNLGTKPDVWFKFVPNSGKVSLRISNNILLSLFSATACNGTYTLARSQFLYGADGQGEKIILNVVAGTTYYLRVAALNSAADFSAGLCLTTDLPSPAERVGIHISSPTANLDIGGSVVLRNSARFNQGMQVITGNLPFTSDNQRVLTADFNGNVDWKNVTALTGIWAQTNPNSAFNVIYTAVPDLNAVGIGTSTPASKLTVIGSVNFTAALGVGTTVAPNNPLEVVAGPSANPTKIIIGNRGGFGPAALEFISDYGQNSQWRPGYIASNDFGNFTGRLEFFTNGSTSANLYGAVKGFEVRNGLALTASGSVSSYSDARVKEQLQPFTDGLNVISQLEPVRFHYKANAPFPSASEQVGVVAQDLEKAAPYMVSQVRENGIEDLRMVNNQAYTFLLINAVKTLEQQVKEQQKQIESLERRMKKH